MKIAIFSILALVIVSIVSTEKAYSAELFHGNEFSFDAFGNYSTTERQALGDVFTDNIRHGNFGGGVGMNYFLLSWIGVGVDANMGANGGQFVDNVMANAILRLPIDIAHVAPYMFGGVGGQFDPRAGWAGDFGVGLEARLNERVGFFADARFVWADKSADYGLGRAGVRIVFW